MTNQFDVSGFLDGGVDFGSMGANINASTAKQRAQSFLSDASAMSGGLQGLSSAVTGKLEGQMAQAEGQAQGMASIGAGIEGLAGGLASGIGPRTFGGGGGNFGISRTPSQLNFNTFGAFG